MKHLVQAVREYVISVHPEQEGKVYFGHENKRKARRRELRLFSCFFVENGKDVPQHVQAIKEVVKKWYSDQGRTIGNVEVEVSGMRYLPKDLKKAGIKYTKDQLSKDGGWVWGWFPDAKPVYNAHIKVTIHDPANCGA